VAFGLAELSCLFQSKPAVIGDNSKRITSLLLLGPKIIRLPSR
jgi:hypothetical protein